MGHYRALLDETPSLSLLLSDTLWVGSSTHFEINEIRSNREPEDESQAQKPMDYRCPFPLGKAIGS